MSLQISPWEAIGLNAAYVTLTGLSLPVVSALGFSDHASQIVAWAGLVAIPLNLALHAISNSTPGPLAPPDAPVVIAAQKVADLPSDAGPIKIEQTKAAAVAAVDNHNP